MLKLIVPKHSAMLAAVGKALQEMAKDQAVIEQRLVSNPVKSAVKPPFCTPSQSEPGTEEASHMVPSEAKIVVTLPGEINSTAIPIKFGITPADAGKELIDSAIKLAEGGSLVCSIVSDLHGAPKHYETKEAAIKDVGPSPVADVIKNMPTPGPVSVIPVGTVTDTQDIPLDPIKDITGRPWDERVDSGGRTLLANGMWKKKRGIDGTTYNAVVEELTGAPVVPDYESKCNPAAQDGQMPAFNDIPEGGAQCVPGATQTITPPPALSMSFSEFMQWYTGPDAIGKFSTEQLTQACNASGIPDIAQLGIPTNAHLVLAVHQTLVATGATA